MQYDKISLISINIQNILNKMYSADNAHALSFPNYSQFQIEYVMQNLLSFSPWVIGLCHIITNAL